MKNFLGPIIYDVRLLTIKSNNEKLKSYIRTNLSLRFSKNRANDALRACGIAA